MTSLTRRSPEVDTIWTVEHLLKSTEDLKAYLELPDEVFKEDVDVTSLIEEDKKLGERGIIMVDTEDPICAAASLFSMEDYTVIAMTEQKLFHRLLEKLSLYIHARTEKVAEEFPGHLWRIYGPEYATEPYLPPDLFKEYEKWKRRRDEPKRWLSRLDRQSGKLRRTLTAYPVRWVRWLP